MGYYKTGYKYICEYMIVLNLALHVLCLNLFTGMIYMYMRCTSKWLLQTIINYFNRVVKDLFFYFLDTEIEIKQITWIVYIKLYIMYNLPTLFWWDPQVIAVADPKKYQREKLQTLCGISDDMAFKGIFSSDWLKNRFMIYTFTQKNYLNLKE